MLCRGYLPPGKHSRAASPTSRHHENGHNSFPLESSNSMLLKRFYIPFFRVHVKQDMSQCLQVFTTCLRFCKNKQKCSSTSEERFSKSLAICSTNKRPLWLSNAAKNRQSRVSITLKDLKLIFSWSTGSFSSCLLRQGENTSNLQQCFSFCTALASTALQLQTT